ncbi:hypothetical protein M409DRAFT_58063 [Zasmidium cellare ATCC 36951]|uniref:Uncharacterized protein n=1 Tax=Zasmidium cellare ATCC 36951 TaxID=1080233 RepID=A0A6A6CB14_ZASCE|nr:uncharacterized protein M409DRAFT_58063 [Zasmidium cellare ATCC 36951]KAF2162646.1 hypothetical protein M409DRAFT_58063 [Zasmidium cellare ATCC 36951]
MPGDSVQSQVSLPGKRIAPFHGGAQRDPSGLRPEADGLDLQSVVATKIARKSQRSSRDAYDQLMLESCAGREAGWWMAGCMNHHLGRQKLADGASSRMVEMVGEPALVLQEPQLVARRLCSCRAHLKRICIAASGGMQYT